ncbi:MAG: shikimate dehydrogenase [Caldilineales bacterium]|nr:shikimate dehydrogenase [Caldilineales bacterium]
MSESSPSYLSELVGVFGFPVAENPTIIMQEAAFRAAGLNWRYLNIEVRPEQLPDAVTGLRAFNMRGINLTIPHKVAVIPLLDGLSPEAALMGAVNTVVARDGKLVGNNTDGKGFLWSLRQDAGIDPAGKEVVFLGAGGAARAMSVELALAGASRITIVNRSAERGQSLVELLNAKTPTSADFVLWSEPYRTPDDTDILVNATSIGLFPDISAMPEVDLSSIRPDLLVCDVIPNPPHTAFLREAKARGARTLDGLGMLVGQGAIGFEMWTGVEAPVAVMRAALEEVFG